MSWNGMKLMEFKYQYALADQGGTKWVDCSYEEWMKTPENQRRVIPKS